MLDASLNIIITIPIEDDGGTGKELRINVKGTDEEDSDYVWTSGRIWSNTFTENNQTNGVRDELK